MPSPPAVRPGDRWREAVSALAVPQAILDAAADPAPVLEASRFRWNPEEDAKQPVRPSRRRALEALPDGGTVLDVGVGGGASSFGLVPKAGLIVGVDPLEAMLDAFAASARELRVEVRPVLGKWPDVAAEVEPADVAVCHHAIYGVAEVEDFLAALTAHARSRVVIEVSTRSPLTQLNPLWKSIHGLDRPDPAVAEELEAVVRAMGLAVEREDISLPPRLPEVTPDLVAFARRRLYVGPEHDAEIEAWLRDREPPQHDVAALWWPGGG
ncbi:MAG TPA: class I SAM-dependent methyltransferase [Acidimicrobiales bacterium]